MVSFFSILVREWMLKTVWTTQESLAEQLETSTVLWLLHAEMAMTANKIGNFKKFFIRDYVFSAKLQCRIGMLPLSPSVWFFFNLVEKSIRMD